MIKKINFYLFLILLFFQNYAVITTEDFGINGLAIFLLIYSVFNFKLVYKSINKKVLIFLGISTLVIFLGAILNRVFYFSQILRIFMIIWLIYVSYKYIERIYKESEQDTFLNCYSNVTFFMFAYGIYEFIANKYSLPLFLNVFNNNPSYAIREVNTYFSGWINKYRLYNVFFEPSIFSLFCVYNFFFIFVNSKISIKKKVILLGLILFNLVFSFARTGWVTMIYMIIIFLCYKFFGKRIKFEKLFIFIPFLNILIMYTVGLLLYDDESALKRTYSVLYYLKNCFSSIKSIIIGHGCGSIVNQTIKIKNIEAVAHNGYVDMIYQYGVIYFVIVLKYVMGIIDKLKNKVLFVSVISTLLCFANYYTVETTVVFTVFIYLWSKNEEIKEIE